VTAAALPSLGSSGPLDYTAKPCPHCGTVVLPAQSSDPVRLRCGNCGFRFLNVAPEKLQLGTTVLMDKQQHQHTPWAYGTSGVGTPMQRQQQQQGGWVSERSPGQHQHQVSLSDTPSDVAAVAAVGGATAAAHIGPPSRRTAVALQERHGSGDTAAAAAAAGPSQYQLPVVQPVMSAFDAVAAVAAAAAANAASSGSASLNTQGVQGPASPADAAGALHGSEAYGSSSSSQRAAVGARAVVSPSDILQVVSEATGIPQQLLTGLTAGATATAAASPAATAATALQELNAIHAALSATVQGQHAAIAAVVGALRLSRMGLAPHQHTLTGLQGGSSLSFSVAAGSARPALSLLFQGPSGVAKTTLAKTLAEALMPGEPQGVLVFSCGELSERHSISRLVGAPPGYVGYGKGGLLTEAIRRRPHSCVLFDDVERAHPDVVGLLLQVGWYGDMQIPFAHVCPVNWQGQLTVMLRIAAFLPACPCTAAPDHAPPIRNKLYVWVACMLMPCCPYPACCGNFAVLSGC
jgi:ribosomal protein S27AE